MTDILRTTGGGKGWSLAVDGTEVMPDLQSEFLDWLLSDPKDPARTEDWALAHDVHKDTVRRWKRDPRFQAEWERRAREKNVSVDRVQDVVDALHRRAVGGDVKAASLYLQYVDRFLPKRKVVVEGRDTSELSDEELLQEVRDLWDGNVAV